MIGSRAGRITAGIVGVTGAAVLATGLNLALLDEGGSAAPPFTATGATVPATVPGTVPGTTAPVPGVDPSGPATAGGSPIGTPPVASTVTTTSRPPGPTSLAPTTSPPASTPAPASQPRTYQVGDAGSVTLRFDGTAITVLDVTDAAGWSHEVQEQRADHVEVRFRSGAGDEAQLQAELEHGELRVEIRAGDDHDD